jgi:hypothetical protein
LVFVEVLAASFNRKNDVPDSGKDSVIVLLPKSSRSYSLHHVSKKNLNLGLPGNLFGSIIWAFNKGADHERSRI